MKITRQLASHGTFCPSAINVLAQIPQNSTFYVQQGLRHPDSIYRRSLEKVAAAFCGVAEGYLAKIQEYGCIVTPGTFEIDQLVAAQEKLLHVLQEHLDELWLVLKTLIDPSLAKKDLLFTDKYVLENRLPGARSFAEAISPYKTSLRITNKLKHQQGCLRGMVVWTTKGPYFGYFLEEPDKAGVIGPSSEIHPDQRAFSFARDLLWHLFNVYACSDKLTNAIQTALNARGVSLNLVPCAGEQIWERVIILAQQLPSCFFPSDRFRKVVNFHNDERAQTLTIEFPRRIHFVLPPIINVSVSVRVDGHSPSFKTPLI
ncbi:MAG: hypothetical protein ABR907_01445 [Terracidiphilus sp.]|jgi:hypothetical protein